MLWYRTVRTLLIPVLLVCSLATAALAGSVSFPVPDEIRSSRFSATLDGQPAAIGHAAMDYHFLNFEVTGNGSEVSITAASDDYWAHGVEVQPWRWNIRPVVKGRTITFRVPGPVKLSITRPGEHLAGAEMLFVFANAPETNVPRVADPTVHYFAAGVYHQNIDVQSGETVYLAAGAVVFGSINVWDVENAKVQGRGTVIYDGPQSPGSDTGWIHKRNWHVIVMHHARNIEISGITCIVRSRTWMIQMLSSRHVTFDNVKTIGGCPGNANQDGMDWLGGGDTLVTDCFFRASDDIFALYGNWLGYKPEDLATPGDDVENIRIERCVLSTSISNIVRVSWPHKIFNSRNFSMKDTDVIHMGVGGCGIPFALMEIWADPEGSGTHTGYHFEDIRMENWYSLVQLEQPRPGVRDVTFSHIWAEDQPPLESSTLLGDVNGVSVGHLKYGNKLVSAREDVPLNAQRGAALATVGADADQLNAAFEPPSVNVRPGVAVDFDASPSHIPQGSTNAHYDWFFGDGVTATGRVASHMFPDAQGTLMDGSGLFRVLLKVTDAQGHSDWTSGPVVVTAELSKATMDKGLSRVQPGLRYSYYEGTWSSLPNLQLEKALDAGVIKNLSTSIRRRADNYALTFDGFLEVPKDGGYTFFLQSRDASELEIDSHALIQSPPTVRQVCGSVGNAVQMGNNSIGLRAGRHQLRVITTKQQGPEGFRLFWRGPGMSITEIPPNALAH